MAELKKMGLTEQQKKRIGCLVYGFDTSGLDGTGNQCPFLEGYAPCRMEMQEKKPMIEECDLFKKGMLLEKVLYDFHLRPRELGRTMTAKEYLEHLQLLQKQRD